MYEELKKLAEGMKGWDKMTECWPCDENGPDWKVGRLDEDENRWPLLTIDTAEYDQEQDAPKIAQYYAAANPSAVLALIADNEACRKSYGGLADCFKSANETINKFSEVIKSQRDANKALKSENEALIKEQDSWHKYAEETRRAFEEVAELRKDAERYRWLRKTDSWNDAEDHAEMIADIWIVESYETVINRSGEKLDQAVDHFMGKDLGQ